MLRDSLCVVTLFLCGTALAADLKGLAKEGYGVLETTRVYGEFQGCNYGRRIPLMNGRTFICATYYYTYSFNPEVYILKNVRSGEIRVLIGDREYPGSIL